MADKEEGMVYVTLVVNLQHDLLTCWGKVETYNDDMDNSDLVFGAVAVSVVALCPYAAVNLKKVYHQNTICPLK